jgi:hypothetical protein
MAASPTAQPARPSSGARIPFSPSVFLADTISYGYAFVVLVATLQFDLQFEIWQGVAIMVLFVLLRGVANELRKDHRRTALAVERRRAHERALAPARWTPEQRDGLGRRVDLGA